MAQAARNLVLGTAGHIDHGKTALVRALTGVDCDRLPEERERGITLELGFAPLDLGDGTRLAVVDVPGHEGLVRTMVAGATGIDLTLLVVAADEGAMPQTREHVAICDLLGIDRGAVALTKCDAVDSEMATLAEEEVRELLAGTSLAELPIVRTSAVSGEGVESLRATLREIADRATPRTLREGPARLPVDRAFVMKGFGTVVSGTLVGGAFGVGEEVTILPGAARARIRGIQQHGESVETLEPGSRCALNLQGIDVGRVPRGAVVVRPDAVATTRVLDARLRWLSDAPALEGPTSALFLSATSEHAARVAPIGAAAIAPGGVGFVRIHMEHGALPLLPGDRFVLRGFARNAAGGHTLGGGVVLDAAPPHRRLSDPALAAELRALHGADPATALRLRVERAGLSGAATRELARETGLGEPRVRGELERLAGNGAVHVGADGVWLAEAAIADLAGRALRALDAFHAAAPLQPGMPAGALRGALPGNAPAGAAARALERLEAAGEIRVEGKTVRRADHAARLSAEDEALVARLREGARDAGLAPPSLREWGERLGVEDARLKNLLAWLERGGELVRTPGELFFASAAVEDLRARVRAHLAAHGSLDTPTYKELIGTTRKHAVPLMELLDGEKLTVRRGELRVLRGGRPD